MSRRFELTLLVLLGAGGCSGGMAEGGLAHAGAPLPPVTGTTPLQRLTTREYDNTVRDLLGETRGFGAGFAPDMLGPGGFRVGGTLTGVEAVQYLDAAEAIARAASRRLDVLLPCRPQQMGEARCASLFIRTFGKRAWRRPLVDEEVDDLASLYRGKRADGASFERGIEAVLTAMLQAPSFLYRAELSAAGRRRSGQLVPLSPYEVASRLSYFLWSTMPDAELLALADSGSLSSREVVDAQARRMLGDARAGSAVADFQAGWLSLDEGGAIEKDRGRFPEWTDALRTSVEAETPRFFSRVVLEGDARMATLLTADFTWVDAPLARLYGIAAPLAGVEVPVTHLVGSGRSGLLTQALLLAKNASPSATSPTRRGKLIRERLLCQLLPPPPPNADMTPPRPKPAASIREQVDEHALRAACSGCHDKIDPIGFTLEGFDAIGRPQKTDGGKPVDVTGALEGTDVDGPLSGPAELGRRLAESDEVRRCMVKQMFRFALGRLELGEERSLQAAYQTFRTADYNVRELMIALTTTEAFMGRTPTDLEKTR